MGQSRNENILENMLGAHNPLGEPQSREEALLMQILEQGGGGGSSTLAGLTDVSVTSPSNEQILKYDGETGKWVNDNIENEIELSKTAGPSSIVSFISETDMPLKSVLADVVATGGNGTPDNPIPINGYSSANITRCGKNMVDKNKYTHSGIGDDVGTIITSDKRLFSGMIAVVPSQNYHYFINGKSVNNEDLIINRFVCYDRNKTFVSRIIVPSISNKSYGFTVPSGVYYIVIDLRTSALTTDISISDIITEQFEIGTEETAYVPYNTASTTVTIAFGQTVYGGVLDVTRGKLHVTHGFNNDLSELPWSQSAQGFFIATLPDVKYATSGSMIPDLKCSALKTVSPSSVYGLTDKSISTANGGAYLWAYDSDYSDAASFQASLSNVQLAYALATPFDIDLTPEVISAIVGENNVFADCGETTVGYYTSIGESIHDLVEESVKFWTDISGTLEAGETEITLTNSAIATSSTIEVFDSLDVPYVSKELSAGSITLTFDAQDSDMSVKVRVS